MAAWHQQHQKPGYQLTPATALSGVNLLSSPANSDSQRQRLTVADNIDGDRCDREEQEIDDEGEEDDDLDDACSSLADSVAWHEDDLIVAAELGKALLERNRRLEQRLRRARASCQERTREATLLASRLAAQRRLDEGRARACDEVERHCAELERRNDQLRAEQRRCLQRIESLASAEAAAEARADDLRRQLASARTSVLLGARAESKKAHMNSGRGGPRRRSISWTDTADAAATADVQRTDDEALVEVADLDKTSTSRVSTEGSTAYGRMPSTPSTTAASRRHHPNQHGSHHREAAPSAPPPINRRQLDSGSRREITEPETENENDEVRAVRRRLISGVHEPSYRALFAEARARLRELLQRPPEAAEGETAAAMTSGAD